MSQAATRWDNRRSGRTTRMLAAAMRRCFSDRVSIVVLARGDFEHVIPILRDLGATYVCKTRRLAKFGEDSTMYFKVPNDKDVISEAFLIQGYREEATFWDHEAVRQAHNRILMKYHEYD